MLPDGLFQCKKLQCLPLGKNSLMDLSPHMGELSNHPHLEYQSLKQSCLIVEENLLNTLPVTEYLQMCLDRC
uniref:Uncharacterized protein n=1 Tax=Aotus nancymaae TaxID=37293 RepID=A0A2K5E8C5_AOTNA